MSVRKESFVTYMFRSLRGGLREILSYGMGRVGMAILIFMVLVSIYSIVAMPGDFPTQWRYVTEPPWIYNPKGVPPYWVKYFGVEVADTLDYKPRVQAARIVTGWRDISSLVPEVSMALGVEELDRIGYAQVYRVFYSLNANSYPQDVLVFFKVRASDEVNLSRVRVEAVMYITRPDHTVLEIGRLSTGLEDLSYMKATHDYFALPYIQRYGLNITLDAMKTLFNRAIFGEPVDPTSGEFRPLKGEYQITLLLVYTGVDPRDLDRVFRQGSLSLDVDVRILGSSYGLLGTDIYGRDLFQGLLFGFPVALTIGFLVSLAIVAIGLTLGVISGYFGGGVDEVIQRFVDILANVPLLPILVLVGVAIQMRGWTGWPALSIIMLILVVFSWGGVTIITRSMALSIKAEPYVEAAKALGASTARILFRHIVPQIIPYTMAVLVFNVPGAIIAEAGLSVLGIDHGLPTWGRILADAQANRGDAYPMWWWILPPGLLLGLFSLAFVSLGFTLETIVEPRLRRR